MADNLTEARALVRRARDEIDSSANHFVDLLEAGQIPSERLRRLAGEQYSILASDRRSFALLAARFPEPPAGPVFLGLAAGEDQAAGLLTTFATALGWGEEDLRAYEPHPGAQAYPAYLAQQAVFGTCGGVALAMLANLDEWGSYCRRIATALADKYGLPEESVGFFRFFAESPPGFADEATATVAQGLGMGDDPGRALRAARMLHAYETDFWNSLAAGL